MAVPYTFGSATTSIPLSQLDSNFATTITLGNTAIQLGNTVTTLNNMTLGNVTISSGTSSLQTNVANATGVLLEANGGTGTTTGYYGFKNRIINGAMVIDQRNAGASQTFTAAAALAYSVDRWYGYCTGANVTGQQVAGSTSPTNTQFRYRFTGAASVTAVGFGQRIEQKNSYDLAGSTATLSADLAISATLTTVTWTASYATTTADTFGTLASPTVTQIATGTFTVSATVTNFNAQITVPAAATTGIQIVFTVGALTAGLTWTIGNVQLEKGSTATSFDYRPYGTELALCQRYYELVSQFVGKATSAGQAEGSLTFLVQKRATPSLTVLNGTNTILELGVATRSFTTIGGAIQVNGGYVTLSGGASMTAPNMCVLYNSPSIIGASSEL